MLFLMAIGPLLTVFGFLSGRATTVSTSDVFLFLGLGLYLVFFLAGTAATTKRNAIFQNLLEVTLFTHNYELCIKFNDGKDVLL